MNKPVCKSTGKRGLFDKEDTVSQLSSIGKPVGNLKKVKRKRKRTSEERKK